MRRKPKDAACKFKWGIACFSSHLLSIRAQVLKADRGPLNSSLGTRHSMKVLHQHQVAAGVVDLREQEGAAVRRNGEPRTW